MKTHFVKYFLFMGTIISLIGFTSCDKKPDDAKEAAEETNEQVMDDRKSEKDAQFLVEAADINLMEVNMGKMAAEKATMPEVKEFAKKMEMHHQKSYDELAVLATSKNITVPGTASDEAVKANQKLMEKNGYDFDRAFMDEMVDGHQKAINKFEKAADDCEDTDIKAWASKTLPDLSAHLEAAKLLKDKVKDMK